MYKYRAQLTKGDEIRYISHLDYAGVMERAIRRAKLPAAYSEGFNPHLKMSFASPLSLGVTSDAEYMDFELTRPLCQPEVFDKLSNALPPGIKLMKLKPVKEPKACQGKKHKALMAEVEQGIYEILVPLMGDWDAVVKAVKGFNAVSEINYHRVTPKKTRDIEVKQYVLEPVQAGMAGALVKLSMNIAITQSGSIKPVEIMELMVKEFGLPVDMGKAMINRSQLLGQGKPLIDLV